MPVAWLCESVAAWGLERLSVKVSGRGLAAAVEDRHADRLGRDAGGEGERAAGGRVIGAGDGRAVGGGVVHRHRLGKVLPSSRDREERLVLGAEVEDLIWICSPLLDPRTDRRWARRS